MGDTRAASVLAATTREDATEEVSLSEVADSIRRRRFPRALRLLDRLPEAERRQPEVRYARAQVALELHDIEAALRSVEGLETAHPDFETEAKTIRLRAAQVSNDVTLLSHFLGQSKEPADLLRLAEAHRRSTSLLEARKLADEALVVLSAPRAKWRSPNKLKWLAKAHEIRAESFLAEGKNTEAAREYRWLATEAASLDQLSNYDDVLAELDPKAALTETERRSRAKTFSENGWVEKTQAELSKLNTPVVRKGDEDALLAWAFFVSRSDYRRASELFARAAARGGPDRQKHLYYEAKALARAHLDHIAIERYDVVAKTAGPYADHASYQAARLRFICGQWQEALSGYQTYLKRFGRSAKHRDQATYDIPILRLALGDYEPAVAELGRLARSASDIRNRVRLEELTGVALLGAGKTERAERVFREVIESYPLSLPALFAAARLQKMGLTPPPAILPAPVTSSPISPLSLQLPPKVQRLSRVGLDEEAERALRLEEPRLRQEFGKRSGEALCKLYGELGSAVRRYQIAQTASTWEVLRFEPKPHDAWQWECVYPTPYQGIVQGETSAFQISPAFVYAVMRQESAFRPTVVSPARAVGLMQIIPPTTLRIAGELGVEPNLELMRAPAENIRFGAYYLRRLLDMFDGRLSLAAAAYNAGPHALSRWLDKGQQLDMDVFVAHIPYTETRNYVYRVLSNYARYTYLSGGEPVEVSLDVPAGLAAPADAY